MAKKERKKPHHRLTIYALKETVEAPDDAIKPRTDAELEHDVVMLGDVEAELYVLPAEERPPRWSKLFKGVVDFEKLGITTSSAAAVLIVPAAGRLFALTFGFGRHLLKPGVWEERFGLKVTLNTIDPKSIRSIDRKSFESLGRHVQEQTTRPAEASEFGLDVEQDMLRAVTGTPLDPTLGTRLHGKDALVANVEFGLEGIVDYLTACHALAQDDTYKALYAWVDHISEIADVALRDELDERLVARIRASNFECLWLAVPDPIDWAQVDGFKFSERKSVNTSPDLQFADLLAQIRDPATLTVKQLKSKKALCFAHDHPFPIHKWSAYQCISFEVNDGSETYLLSGGKWYRVASSYVEQINSFVANVAPSTLTLPAYDHANEADYNQKVYASDTAYYALLDQKLIYHGGGHSKFELCDLMTVEGHLIHVKKYSGSAVLSHLFAQAAVAGELLFMDPEFRNKANNLPPCAGRFAGILSPSEYEIVLAIITWSKKEFTLPFFSRVSLRAATQRLRAFGYTVSLLPIPSPRASRVD